MTKPNWLGKGGDHTFHPADKEDSTALGEGSRGVNRMQMAARLAILLYRHTAWRKHVGVEIFAAQDQQRNGKRKSSFTHLIFTYQSAK